MGTLKGFLCLYASHKGFNLHGLRVGSQRHEGSVVTVCAREVSNVP